MNKQSLVGKVKSWFGIGGVNEGHPRGPFMGIGEFGNSFTLGGWEDGFQRNLDLSPGGADQISAVYSCVMLTARAVSQCKPKHTRRNDDKGTFEQINTSPQNRLFRRPNDYQTFNHLMLNTVADLLFRGSALWFVTRDERNVIVNVHQVRSGSWSPYVDPETHEVFYNISVNDLHPLESPDYMIPARDCVNFRQYSPRHPLIGSSPIEHAALAAGVNVALSEMQLSFFRNMNRASGVLQTDEPLTSDQKDQARAAFAKQAKAWSAGGVPVLSHGVKYQPLTLSSQDQQLVEAQKLSIREIGNVYGVPLVLLGDTGSTSAGTESLINHWMAVGLGAVIETLERSLDHLFNFGPDDRIELDPTPLMRVDMKTRFDALGSAILHGCLSPNEVRLQEGYGGVEGGDSVFLQRQMTSIDALNKLNEADLAGKYAKEIQPEPEPEPEPPPDETKEFNEVIAKAGVINLLDIKRKKSA
jgi:HK97 family phage portal protein